MYILLCNGVSIKNIVSNSGVHYTPESDINNKSIVLYNGLGTPVPNDYVINKNGEMLRVLECQECSIGILEVYQRYPDVDIAVALIDRREVGTSINHSIFYNIYDYDIYVVDEIMQSLKEKLE